MTDSRMAGDRLAYLEAETRHWFPKLVGWKNWVMREAIHEIRESWHDIDRLQAEVKRLREQPVAKGEK